jgi:hypothetical protein
MVPEISHRCPSCGVAVRERDALFCPECGKALKDISTTDAASEPNKIVDNATIAHESEPPTVAARTVAPESELPTVSATTPAPESEPPTVSAPSPVATTRVEADAGSHPHGIAEKTRETLHRASAVASAAARGVIEEPVKRVERIRHASTHVIEEASYDPSLRFVLVALALFVVFLILLVLSKVMG